MRTLLFIALISLPYAGYSEELGNRKLLEECKYYIEESYRHTTPDYNSGMDGIAMGFSALAHCLELNSYPKDVRDFLPKAQTCFGYLEIMDGDEKIVGEEIRKEGCRTTVPEQEKHLLEKYKSDPIITKALQNFAIKYYID